jgi:hypothetical protein
MKREKDTDANTANLTYYGDEGSPAGEYSGSPTDDVAGEKIVAGPEYRAPALNAASNF